MTRKSDLIIEVPKGSLAAESYNVGSKLAHAPSTLGVAEVDNLGYRWHNNNNPDYDLRRQWRIHRYGEDDPGWLKAIRTDAGQLNIEGEFNKWAKAQKRKPEPAQPPSSPKGKFVAPPSGATAPLENHNRRNGSAFTRMTNKKRGGMTLAKAPVSRSIQMPRSHYKYNGREQIVISHREYIGDVTSTGTSFNAIAFASLMPGDPTSYPWLSKMAGMFAKYTWRKAKLIYVPTCSTSTAGAVIMAFDPNAQRPTPTNKTAILEYECSARGAPWVENYMDCYGMEKNLFSIYGNSPITGQQGGLTAGTNVDIKTYSAGQIFVGCDGVAAGTVGEIHMEFEVEFKEPGVFTNPMVQFHINVKQPSSATDPWSSSSALTPPDIRTNIALPPSAVTGNSIKFPDFPVGCYLVLFEAITTAAMVNPFITPSGTDVSFITNGYAAGTTACCAWTFMEITVPTDLTLTPNNLSSLNTTSTGRTNLTILPFDKGLGVYTY